MIIKLTWILFGHYILDYPLRGEFLVTTKVKMFSSLFAHSMIYSLGISLIIYYNTHINNNTLLGVFMIILGTHIIIDFWKSELSDKKHMSKNLLIDQLLHICINLFLFIVL